METQHDELATWAEAEFGHALVGDERRRKRLVAMAASAARQPAGTVTAVFPNAAEREGAFRLLKNESVHSAAVAESVFVATARRCAAEPYVFVAVDGSSLTLTDRARGRELGRVGSHASTRGLLMMNSLAVAPSGAPLGLLDQRWWARDQPKRPKKKNPTKCSRVPFEQKETRHWVDALVAVQDQMVTHAPATQPWFQLDRGADCWPVLAKAVEHNLLLTTRAVYNRRLVSEDGQRRYFYDELKRQPVLGHYDLELPARANRPARVARVEVRACTVTLDLAVSRKRHIQVTLQAVLAEEISTSGKTQLRWMLLTTHPVTTFEQACLVIHGYTQRWRVEEFHRAWKSGVCNVETTQLQRREALLKWATILAAVATRAVRLAYLGRTTPDVPASSEFTPEEIDAAFLLAKRKRDRRKRVLLREMIALIAEQGGFAGKYSGRPPGAQVLARGLRRIEVVAEGLRNMAEM
jgi:hypothetical protein